jgi:hypothetical protein
VVPGTDEPVVEEMPEIVEEPAEVAEELLPSNAALMIAPGALGVPFQSEIKLGNPHPNGHFQK